MIDLAVDPGKHGCGVAAFRDGELLHAEYAPEVHATTTRRHFVHEVADGVDIVVRRIGGTSSLFNKVVIERPQVYQTARQKGDQDDLVELALVAGAVARLLAGNLTFVLPAQWKGQAPKDVTRRRVQKALSVEERQRVFLDPHRKTLHHNVFDAVGLGLWAFREGGIR